LALHRTGLSERFLDPPYEVTIKIHPAPDFDHIPVPAHTLRVMIAKRTPLPRALKELGMTSLASLVWACHRVGIQWPGIPRAVDDPRIIVIQRALDRLAADQARRAVKAAAEAEAAPGDPALAPARAPAPDAPAPQQEVGAAPQVSEPVATSLPTPALAMESKPTPRAAVPRGRPRVLPITTDALAAMEREGISVAEVCVRLKVTAKQFVGWCQRNDTTYPGIPAQGTKGVAALQAQVDAAAPVSSCRSLLAH